MPHFASPTRPLPTLLIVAAVACGGFVLGGCAAEQELTAPEPITLSEQQYDQGFDAARDTLRDWGFYIDRQDYRFGLVTTQPRTAPSIFEPWHADNQSNDMVAENTFNHQRRRVVVKLTRESVAAYAMDVQVLLERRQVPTRRVIGASSRSGSAFSTLTEVPGEMMDRGQLRDEYWVSVGRDHALEQVLTEQIAARMHPAAE